MKGRVNDDSQRQLGDIYLSFFFLDSNDIDRFTPIFNCFCFFLTITLNVSLSAGKNEETNNFKNTVKDIFKLKIG